MPKLPEPAELAQDLFAAWSMDEASVRNLWANDPNLIAIQAPGVDIPAAVTLRCPYAPQSLPASPAGQDKAHPHQEAPHV